MFGFRDFSAIAAQIPSGFVGFEMVSIACCFRPCQRGLICSSHLFVWKTRGVFGELSKSHSSVAYRLPNTGCSHVGRITVGSSSTPEHSGAGSVVHLPS